MEVAGSIVLTALGWVASPLVEKLLNEGFARLGVGAEKKLQKLRITILPVLKSVIEEAEGSEHQSEVEEWLQRLKDAYDDAEDALDLLNYHHLEQKVAGAASSSMRQGIFNWVSRPFNPTQNELWRSLKELEETANEAEKFRCWLGELNEKREAVSDSRQTISLPPKKVFGRDEDREEIIRRLKMEPAAAISDPGSSSMSINTGSSGIPIIAIVGRPGLGKTTLAQYVCEQLKSELDNSKHFDLVMWVHASHRFSASEIMKEIIQLASIASESQDLGNLKPEALRLKMNEKLKKKKFMLVIDDVWCEGEDHRNNWDTLFNCLSNLPVGVGEVTIHTLQFADDLLLFFDGSLKAAEVINIVLEAFSSASGLKINFSKSRIIPVNLETAQTTRLANLFNCPVEGFPFTYLGLPLSPKPLRKPDYLPLIEKIGNRLAGWKGRLLSRAGRLILVNSVLSTVPSYFGSVFKIPTWAIKEIDRTRRAFFWKGKGHISGFHCLVNWKQVCRPKAVGGLGIRNLFAANRALLMKGLWTFYKDKERPWVRLLRCKHYRRKLPCGGGSVPTNCAPLWKGVLTTSGSFHSAVSFRIGDGSTIPFWHAKWTGDKPLRDRFPTLFAAASLRHITVKRWMISFANRDNFDCFDQSALDTAGQSEITQLRNVIQNTILQAEPDTIVWGGSYKGIFSASSAYRILVSDGRDERRILHLWKIKIPLRTKIFLWLAARNRLLTADCLTKRGWQGPSLCVCCYGDEETLEHLLFNCPFARSVWSRILQGNQPGLTALLRGSGDIAHRWTRLKSATALNERNQIDEWVAATCWELWMERNFRIFEDKPSSTGECTRRICNSVTLWRKALALGG